MEKQILSQPAEIFLAALQPRGKGNRWSLWKPEFLSNSKGVSGFSQTVEWDWLASVRGRLSIKFSKIIRKWYFKSYIAGFTISPQYSLRGRDEGITHIGLHERLGQDSNQDACKVSDDLLSVLLFSKGCYKTSPASIPLECGSKFHTTERAELGLGSREGQHPWFIQLTAEKQLIKMLVSTTTHD